MVRSIRLSNEVVRCVQSVVCNKRFKILFKYPQDKYMGCGQLTITLGGEKEKLKEAEEIIC